MRQDSGSADSAPGIRAAAEWLYLFALALLPWRWFPPFPWLHVHAQWGDMLVAAAVIVWMIDVLRAHRRPLLARAHAAMGLYLAWAAVSLVVHVDDATVSAWKLVGMAELVTLAVMTSDLASRPVLRARLHRVVALSALVTAASAICGVILHVMGFTTPLVGGYGDLTAGAYARARAGFDHPNLLGSYCLFAWSLTSREDLGLHRWVRRVCLGAVLVTLFLTFSRAILAYPTLLLVRRATTPAWKRLAGAYFCAAALGLVALTFVNLSLDPTRFWEATVDSRPSPRRQAFVTSFETFIQRPLFGSGVGTSPGRVGDVPFDAHCTPLNVAATLGAPAFLAFAAVWLVLWHQRQRAFDVATWGALAAMALDGLAQDIEDFRHLWVLFGLGASSGNGHAGLLSGVRPSRLPARSLRYPSTF